MASEILHSFRKRLAMFKGGSAVDAYARRVKAEKNTYANCSNVHELPAIFHYWSNRYLRPKLEAFGFSHPNQLFEQQLARQCARDRNAANSFVSIGAGNCDMEVALATSLRNQGFDNFEIECLELNDKMLDRGRQLASDAHLSSNLTFVQADFNRWRPSHTYDGVIANQALHHVQELELLFDSIKRSMKPNALLIVSDMIGRNGHLRWPEALTIVNEFWASLPQKYKYNHQLKRLEEAYVNWDCSTEGFEGIRAQDILPLLVRHFHFDLFIGFGNVIDPFIDRSFGPNFDETCEWDRSFIDRVHERDEQEMIAGRVKPTHMIGVLTKEPTEDRKYHPPLSPEFSIRSPHS